ncbi:MAG TPA: hypothetical protein VF179_18520 [Thermoanaerobaculia bacterium]|nr:hypothetical protein [Thermoanaerobaculia bacterium]
MAAHNGYRTRNRETEQEKENKPRDKNIGEKEWSYIEESNYGSHLNSCKDVEAGPEAVHL